MEQVTVGCPSQGGLTLISRQSLCLDGRPLLLGVQRDALGNLSAGPLLRLPLPTRSLGETKGSRRSPTTRLEAALGSALPKHTQVGRAVKLNLVVCIDSRRVLGDHVCASE